MLLRFFLIINVLLLIGGTGIAQKPQSEIMEYFIEGKDTIYMDYLPEVTIYPKRKFKNKRDYRKFYRTVYNLKRVYPYSQIAKAKLSEIDQRYKQLPGREQKKYLKKFENELFAEFEAPLKKLTRSQGKMLIKLIDRETGESTYDIVKEFKGGFKAFWWQSFARLFGSNLKARYDRYGEDEVLEELVVMCEKDTFDDLYRSMYGNK